MLMQHMRDSFVKPLIYETTDAEALSGLGGYDDGNWLQHQGGP